MSSWQLGTENNELIEIR